MFQLQPFLTPLTAVQAILFAIALAILEIAATNTFPSLKL